MDHVGHGVEADITLFVKHPHGEMYLINLAPPSDPAPLPPGARRPVIALLDSPVESHPWLDTPGGPFATVLALPGPGPDVSVGGAEKFLDPVPVSLRQHGTFNAGVIRRLAPDSTVLSVPVMAPGEDIDHDRVQQALSAVLARVQSHRPDEFVDVMCLPFGYREGRAPPEHIGEERRLLDELASHGVLVVAAAGNFGTDEPVFPAAFGVTAPASGPAVLSVGALDTGADPARACYSGHGAWVRHWEVGVADSIVADPPGSFAHGRGTSIAAARVAAKLAVQLGSTLGSDPHSLNDVSDDAVIARATLALSRLG